MAWTQEEEELYIGGFNTTEDIIECIKDNIDEGNLDTAKDYLNQLNDYLKPRLAGQMYNTILYIGTFLMIGGFSLFLYFEMKERQLDREAFKSQQLTKSFNKAKEEEMK